MGCGKSVVGVLVARRAGVPFMDLDLIIESEAGMPISEFFATHGEEAFRVLESRLLPTVLQPETVVALGGGAPIDDQNWSLIKERSVPVFIDCEFETVWKRTAGSTNRPLRAGRSREELRALHETRLPRYRQALHHVNGELDVEAVAEEVLKLWSD